MQVPVELKIKYLSRRSADIERLRHSLDNGDFTGALKLGHQVKGNADTFEFPQMTNLGLEIEKAARDQNKEAVRFLMEKMESVIQNARSLFSSHYPLK